MDGELTNETVVALPCPACGSPAGVACQYAPDAAHNGWVHIARFGDNKPVLRAITPAPSDQGEALNNSSDRLIESTDKLLAMHERAEAAEQALSDLKAEQALDKNALQAALLVLANMRPPLEINGSNQNALKDWDWATDAARARLSKGEGE